MIQYFHQISSNQLLLSIGLTLIFLYILSIPVSISKNRAKASNASKLALKKRIQRDQHIKDNPIPKLNTSPSLKEKILNSDVVALQQMLQSQETTSEEILITYLERASTIGLTLELLADTNFEEALQQARECDRLRKEDPEKCQGALFGIPMSIKDCFNLKGTDTSFGMTSRLFNPEKEDGYIVKILKEEGAIIFTKSNLPQALLGLDTLNHIYGEAKNPWDQTRSAGGSSGGEGGLIAARCSPLGMGNDMGGSILFPAANCGIVGFKPTLERVTNAGTGKLSQSMDNLMVAGMSVGPLAKSVRDVEVFMKAVLSERAHERAKLSERDPSYIRKEWQESLVTKTNNQKLRIGYFKRIELFPPDLANQRAVEEAIQLLKTQGHEVVEVEFPVLEKLGMMFSEAWFCEGDAKYLQELKGEKTMSHCDGVKLAAAAPNCLKGALAGLLSLFGEERAGMIFSYSRKMDAYEYFGLVERHKGAKKEFFKKWQDYKLDGLISPGFGYAAQKLGYGADLAFGGILYTAPFNMLNMPAGVVPVTVVKKGEDVYPKECCKYRDMMTKKLEKSLEGSVGLPVGVHVSTLPWEEEKCLGIMMQIEEAVKFREKYSCPK